jgi:SAM-dependent methyltransferase
MSDTKNAHYDEAYFSWQEKVGNFGGTANQIKFREFIKPTDKVVDFGAGGGFLLSKLNCAEKIGVEINPIARAHAAKLGNRMLESLDELPDDYADVIVSNHALEHIDFPLSHLQRAWRKLKPGGLIVFVVPCEQVGYKWVAGDVNFHIYSWGPMCFGNLFTRAGFDVIEAKPFYHKWPPNFVLVHKLLGWRIFHVVCRIWGHLARHYIQVRCIARKPLTAS